MSNVNGLEGIIAAETEISLVDGAKGRLVYRGYNAPVLAVSHTFEEIAYLLWYGHMPQESELTRLHQALCESRHLPSHVIQILGLLPEDTGLMDVLRTAISATGTINIWPPTIEDAIRFTALVPTVIAYWFAKIRHVPFTQPTESLSHVANYLYMIRDGAPPPDDHVRALETYLIAGMEHGMNASTFSARVVTSTESDMASALVAAIGAMKGPLHGGAPSEVMNMLDDIGTISHVEPWIRHELDAGHKLMGFGHRVYKTTDPRARALREVVKGMEIRDSWLELALKVEETAVKLLAEYKPNRKLFANVEFWAAAVFRALKFEKILYTPTFTVARTVGWTTHILEQAANNRLIRPTSKYIGTISSHEE